MEAGKINECVWAETLASNWGMAGNTVIARQHSGDPRTGRSGGRKAEMRTEAEPEVCV